MRIRSIKPEFWRSQDISRLDIEDRFLFIGLWSYVDDNGVGEDRVPMISADLFADDIERDPRETFARVSRGLARLSEGGQIIRFTADGRDYFEVTKWKSHQRIDKPGKARLPHHDAPGSVIRECSRQSRDTLAPGSGNREQGSGSREQGSDVAIPSLDLDELFDAAYSRWPKKDKRKESLAKFKIACRKRDPQELADDIARFGDAYAATTEVQFVPALVVWLNGERWTDPLPEARGGQQSRVQAGLSVADELRGMEERYAGE